MKNASVAAVALAFVLPFTVPSQGFAQQDGDQKCSPSGEILEYSEVLKRWTSVLGKCDPTGGRSSEREPMEGDQKCSPDGFVMTYSRLTHEWRVTPTRCGSQG